MTDKTIVIPGHGKLKKQGKSLAETIAAKPTAAYDAKWGQFLMTPVIFTKLVFGSSVRDTDHPIDAASGRVVDEGIEAIPPRVSDVNHLDTSPKVGRVRRFAMSHAEEVGRDDTKSIGQKGNAIVELERRRGKTVQQDGGRFRRVPGLAVEEPKGLQNRRLVLTYARNR